MTDQSDRWTGAWFMLAGTACFLAGLHGAVYGIRWQRFGYEAALPPGPPGAVLALVGLLYVAWGLALRRERRAPPPPGPSPVQPRPTRQPRSARQRKRKRR